MPVSSGPEPARAPRRRRRITRRLTSRALRNPWLAAGLLFGALLGLALVLVFIGAVGVVTQNPCAGNETEAPGGGRWVAASTYGGPDDPSVHGDGGAYGHLAGTMAFAELSNNWSAPLGQLDFSALGKLPPHVKVRVTYKGRSVVALKLDVGAGGPGFRGHKRAIDLWYQTAQALRFSGLDLVQVEPVSGHAQLTAAGREPAAPDGRVHRDRVVEERIETHLAGRSPCLYISPPQLHTSALEIVRLLLSRPAEEVGTGPWRTAIAGGERELRLQPCLSHGQVRLDL